MILFPVRPGTRRRLGSPFPAEPCRCEHPIFLVQDDLPTCARCGHLNQDEIRAEWETQAKRTAMAA